MIAIMYLWAYDYSHKNHVIKVAVIWLRRMYTLQLVSLAVTEIVIVKESLAEI